MLVGSAVAVALCTAAAAAPSSEPPPLTPARLGLGQRVYERQCASCHGLSGAGNGPAAYLLSPKPRDFTRDQFRLVSTTTMEATGEDLYRTITRGMPGSAMPPWEHLAPADRWAVVAYVRYLAELPKARRDGRVTDRMAARGIPWAVKRSLATATTDPAFGVQVPPEPPATPQGLARGRRLFAQACASCHGPQGRGDGQTVMVDNLGYPTRPRDLTRGVFKGASESKDLYYRIVAGLPGSPMPSYAGVYTDEQLWDLIHYVQSLVPAGVGERVRLRVVSLTARRIRGALPRDARDPAWDAVPSQWVALAPLWWRDDRVEGLEVKAMHDGTALAIRLAWRDATEDRSLMTPQAFSDGAALEISTDPEPPFFGMGDARGAVRIWFWKASWQEDLHGWRDVEHEYPHAAVDGYPAQRTYQHGDPFEVSQSKTVSHDPAFMGGWGAGNPLSDPTRQSAAEEATAKGPGTLTSRAPSMPRIHANGLWQDGRWQVVLTRDLKFRPGQEVRVAFAIWDGSAHDRNGQKSVSVWNRLSLER